MIYEVKLQGRRSTRTIQWRHNGRHDISVWAAVCLGKANIIAHVIGQQWPVVSPHIYPVTRKALDGVIPNTGDNVIGLKIFQF